MVEFNQKFEWAEACTIYLVNPISDPPCTQLTLRKIFTTNQFLNIDQKAAATKHMHWYLVYTRFLHEKKVIERLGQKGFETLLPVVERPSQKNRQERVTVPLFPCYLLVRAEMNTSTYLKILKTDSVVGFFRNNGRPVIISDKQVNDIKKEKDIKVFPDSKQNTEGQAFKHRQ